MSPDELDVIAADAKRHWDGLSDLEYARPQMWAKLTEDLCKLHEEGWSYARIGRLLGVTRQRAFQIVNPTKETTEA
jgi:hypothetical protein